MFITLNILRLMVILACFFSLLFILFFFLRIIELIRITDTIIRKKRFGPPNALRAIDSE